MKTLTYEGIVYDLEAMSAKKIKDTFLPLFVEFIECDLDLRDFYWSKEPVSILAYYYDELKSAGCLLNGCFINTNKNTIYLKDGELHRADGPAIYANGDKHWYLNGQLHRTDGPAIEYANGSKIWYLNGQLHRTDGPAIEWADGDKEWYINGLRHRIDGPAVERSNGNKWWYINGDILTEKEFNP